jgi:hypothetical protein
MQIGGPHLGGVNSTFCRPVAGQLTGRPMTPSAVSRSIVAVVLSPSSRVRGKERSVMMTSVSTPGRAGSITDASQPASVCSRQPSQTPPTALRLAWSK